MPVFNMTLCTVVCGTLKTLDALQLPISLFLIASTAAVFLSGSIFFSFELSVNPEAITHKVLTS